MTDRAALRQLDDGSWDREIAKESINTVRAALGLPPLSGEDVEDGELTITEYLDKHRGSA